MDSGTLRGLLTAVLIIAFLGLWAWAWSARRRKTFDAAARLPLEEHGDAPPPAPARRENER